MKIYNKIFICLIAVCLCTAAVFMLKAPSGSYSAPEIAITPVPTPTPVPKPDYAAMETELTDMLSQQQGDWSLYFEMHDTGDVVSINSHQVYSASLIKLFVAQAVYARINEGIMSDSDTVESLLSRMLSYSDNDAWTELARRIGSGSYSAGMQNVTTLAQQIGFGDTGTFYKGAHKNFNFTSVNDCGTYLRMLLNGEIVSPEYSEKILEKLKAQAHLQKLPSGVPEGIETASKTGELEYQQGDSMIVYAPSGTYILVLIGDGLSDSYGTIPFFGQVSETVYKYIDIK